MRPEPGPQKSDTHQNEDETEVFKTRRMGAWQVQVTRSSCHDSKSSNKTASNTTGMMTDSPHCAPSKPSVASSGPSP